VYLLRAVAKNGAAADGDLRWLAAGDLGVYADEWAGPREVTREGMLEHHRIVGLIHEKVDCLPMRFGEWVDDEEEAARLVDARRESLGRALERVRGKTEFAVTLVWDEPLVRGSATGGREYMAKRRAYWATRREREKAVREWSSALGADALVKIYPNERVALSAALLLPRGSTPRVSAMPGTRLVVNGPWPPYSFATAE
jgi:hypothetical protein